MKLLELAKEMNGSGPFKVCVCVCVCVCVHMLCKKCAYVNICVLKVYAVAY